MKIEPFFKKVLFFFGAFGSLIIKPQFLHFHKKYSTVNSMNEGCIETYFFSYKILLFNFLKYVISSGNSWCFW